MNQRPAVALNEGLYIMWYEELGREEQRIISMLAGKLDLPSFSQYQSMAHFLNDVYSRICEAKSLTIQINKLLGV